MIKASVGKPIDSQRTFGLVNLPPFSERQLIGNWLIEGMSMTRSIELAEGVYFLVSRLFSEAGLPVGGDQGLRLTRVSDTEFRGVPPNTMIYRIASSGELLCQLHGEKAPSMRGIPHQALWPQ
ncbi:hypothetical protein [Ideonella oryzae]|uniref:AraC family transcriptional regulator n=1 Tax=Ideonella oryzae TaxID=2937441 RepID=A0ABT1BR36_9BURK|nr:hypothetical protein [Ideonella oryzae]MCO5978676.1 hypothetical protein [Ideonella oryzae]